MALFVLVRTDKDAATGAYVKVIYTLPHDRVLVSEPVSEVRVGVRGPWTRLKNFDERDLDPIHVDLSRFRGGEVRFDDAQVKLPVGLRVTSISPSAVRLETEPRVARTLPVEVEMDGSPVEGFRVVKVEIDPLTVGVEGGKREVERMSRLLTKPLRLAELQETQTVELALQAPPRNVQYVASDKVQVKIVIASVLGDSEFERVPIRVVGGTGHVLIQPFFARVLVHGPASAIRALSAHQIVLTVDGRSEVHGVVRPISVHGLPSLASAEVIPSTVTLLRRVH